MPAILPLRFLNSPLDASADLLPVSRRAKTQAVAAPPSPTTEPHLAEQLAPPLPLDAVVVRQAKWRRNLQRGIVPSMALQAVVHGIYSLTAHNLGASTTATALGGLSAGTLLAGAGLGIYARSLPRTDLPWSPHFCASAKWFLTSGAILGAATTYLTGGPGHMVATYGAFAGVYGSIGAVMTGVGLYRKRHAAYALVRSSDVGNV